MSVFCCDTMDYSFPGPSIHGISQARILEWLPLPSLGDLPDPGIEPATPALAGGFFTAEPPGRPTCMYMYRYIHTCTRTHTQHIYNGILPVHYFLLFIELYDQNSKQFLSPEYFIRPLLFFTLKLLNYIIFKNSCHGQFVLSVP